MVRAVVADRDTTAKTSDTTLLKIVKEPLVHLLVGGALLFLLLAPGPDATLDAPESTDAAALVGGNPSVSSRTIMVDKALRARLKRSFQSRFGKNPTPADLEMLISRHIDDEVLYRTGMRRGLASDDAVVRQRVIQKMRMALNATSGTKPPSDDAIVTFYSQNSERYMAPATVTFRHVFGDTLTDELKTSLQAGTVDAAKAGKPFSKGHIFRRHTAPKVDAAFGPGFAAQLATLPPKTWQGPFKSTYGQHLVWVEKRTPAAPQPLRVVRRRVLSDMAAEAARKSPATPLSKLRESFTVQTTQ